MLGGARVRPASSSASGGMNYAQRGSSLFRMATTLLRRDCLLSHICKMVHAHNTVASVRPRSATATVADRSSARPVPSMRARSRHMTYPSRYVSATNAMDSWCPSSSWLPCALLFRLARMHPSTHLTRPARCSGPVRPQFHSRSAPPRRRVTPSCRASSTRNQRFALSLCVCRYCSRDCCVAYSCMQDVVDDEEGTEPANTLWDAHFS